MSTATRFLVSLLSLCALLCAQSNPELIRQFGEPGEPGSYRVGFSSRSAGILWLQATDHFVSLEKARHEERQRGLTHFLGLDELFRGLTEPGPEPYK